MSILATLNQPSIVSAAGLAAGASLPVLKSANLPLPAICFLQGLTYACNVWSTSQPGRLDGQVVNNEDVVNKSIFVPSGWAFAIWGPIFLGEFVYCIASFFSRKESDQALIRQAAPGFIAAQVFQSLWAAAFRPKYYDDERKWPAFVSAALLGGIALSLHQAHIPIAASGVSGLSYFLYALPLTLHCGWTTAATLVNINGSVARVFSGSAWGKGVGYASAVVAAGLGGGVTLGRQAPVWGSVIVWALTACATSPQARGERVQVGLCGGGALGVAAVVGVSIWKIWSGKALS